MYATEPPLYATKRLNKPAKRIADWDSLRTRDAAVYHLHGYMYVTREFSDRQTDGRITDVKKDAPTDQPTAGL